MLKQVNKYHPRMIDEKGNIVPIPLLNDTGYLNTHITTKKNIERISKQVSMYFKVLKSLSIVFSVLAVFSLTLISCYNWGEFDLNTFKDNTIKNSLGNLGSTSMQCH